MLDIEDALVVHEEEPPAFVPVRDLGVDALSVAGVGEDKDVATVGYGASSDVLGGASCFSEAFVHCFGHALDVLRGDQLATRDADCLADVTNRLTLILVEGGAS